MQNLIKRTHVYVLCPSQYEISGHNCGNEDPDWSEYQGHLWCQKCQVDFLPTWGGVFDGPVLIHTAHLIGLCFATIDLATGELTKCCETCDATLR